MDKLLSASYVYYLLSSEWDIQECAQFPTVHIPVYLTQREFQSDS